MEISQFISKSIEQVVSGLLKAQESVAIQGVDIRSSGAAPGYSEIDFDLAVTTKINKGRGGDVELSVLGAELKLGKSRDLINTSTSRLRFSVEFSIPEEEMKLAAESGRKASVKGLG